MYILYKSTIYVIDTLNTYRRYLLVYTYICTQHYSANTSF